MRNEKVLSFIWVRAANETSCSCHTDVFWEQDKNGPIKCEGCGKVITEKTVQMATVELERINTSY